MKNPSGNQTTVSHSFAKQAIRYLLVFEGDKLLKETLVVFNRP